MSIIQQSAQRKRDYDYGNYNQQELFIHTIHMLLGLMFYVVQGEGFEPPNPEGADLQSAVFDRFTNPALLTHALVPASWSRQRDSNPRPAVYKTAALATELCRQCAITDVSVAN